MKINPYKTWLATALTLGTVTLVSTIFYLYLYIVSIENLIQAMEIRPKLINTASNTIVYLLESFSLNQEYIIRNDSNGIFSVIPEYNLIPDVQNLSYSKILKYKQKHTHLKKQLQGFSVETSKITDILYKEADTSFLYLSLGLDYAQSVYVSDIIHMRSLTSYDLAQHNSMEIISETMIASYERINDEMKKYMTENIERERDSATVFISFFCVFIAGMYLFVLVPIISNVEKTVTSCWSFFNTFNLGDMNNS